MRAPRIAGLAILSLLLVLLWPRSDRETLEPAAQNSLDEAANGTPPRDAPGGDSAHDAAEAHGGPTAVRTTIAAEAGDDQSPWTVQFTGLHPSVPWTAPVGFVFFDVILPPVAVDERGAARFVPPPVARGAGVQTFAIVTSDPNYRIAEATPLTLPLQRSAHTEVRVYPVARLHGRVLDPTGQGTVARIEAFAIGRDGPHDPPIARTNSKPDGSYLLRVPPAIKVLLVAESVVELPRLPWGEDSDLPPAFEHGDAAARDDRLGHDPRRPRLDWWPAALTADGLHGTERVVPELRLRATALLTGHVTCADGQPLSRVEIVAAPQRRATATFGSGSQWSPTEGLHRSVRIRTDERGRFTLSLPQGEEFAVTTRSEEPLLVAGEPTAVATAPGHVELRAEGDLVTLSVIDNGAPVAAADIDIGGRTIRTDKNGQRRVTLSLGHVRLRAQHEASTSPFVELPPGPRPAALALALEAKQLAPVRIALVANPPPDTATFTWQPADGGAPIEFWRPRDSKLAQFSMAVPAGRYRLSCVGTAMPFMDCTIPLQRDIEVPTTGFDATFAVAYGGTIALDVFDHRGMRPRGRFTVRDVTGRVLPMTAEAYRDGSTIVGGEGELLPLGQNHLRGTLPIGRYDLVVEAEGGERAQQTVVLRSRARSSVVLRPR